MSGRRGLILAVLVVAVAVGGFAAWRAGHSASDTIEVSGDVRADIRVVTAPAIVTPVPDYAVGIPVAPAASTGSSARNAATPVSVSGPRVAGALATVTVGLGDHVDAGDVVAKLDTTMLDLGVESARLAAVRARAELGMLDSNLSAIADNRSKLETAKSKLSGTKAKILATQAQLRRSRADLVTTRAKAIAGRTALAAQIAQLEKLIADGTATSTPPAPTPEQMLAGMKTKLAQLDAGIAKMNAGLLQIDAGLARIAEGLAKLSSARSQIAAGESALDTAVRQIGNAKDVLGIMADARVLGAQAAVVARDSATITAPVAGTVAFARTAGSVAMVGAPLVRIRPEGPRLVDTYLTAEQLGRVSLGDVAEVTLDSMPGRFRGKVSQIGSAYRYPPNSFPTPLTHMTRAVKVTITLDDETLPFGAPVDVVINTTARN